MTLLEVKSAQEYSSFMHLIAGKCNTVPLVEESVRKCPHTTCNKTCKKKY